MTGTAGWTGLLAGILAAFTVDRLVAGGVLDLSGQGGAFVGAGAGGGEQEGEQGEGG